MTICITRYLRPPATASSWRHDHSRFAKAIRTDVARHPLFWTGLLSRKKKRYNNCLSGLYLTYPSFESVVRDSVSIQTSRVNTFQRFVSSFSHFSFLPPTLFSIMGLSEPKQPRRSLAAAHRAAIRRTSGLVPPRRLGESGWSSRRRCSRLREHVEGSTDVNGQERRINKSVTETAPTADGKPRVTREGSKSEPLTEIVVKDKEAVISSSSKLRQICAHSPPISHKNSMIKSKHEPVPTVKGKPCDSKTAPKVEPRKKDVANSKREPSLAAKGKSHNTKAVSIAKLRKKVSSLTAAEQPCEANAVVSKAKLRKQESSLTVGDKTRASKTVPDIKYSKAEPRKRDAAKNKTESTDTVDKKLHGRMADAHSGLPKEDVDKKSRSNGHGSQGPYARGVELPAIVQPPRLGEFITDIQFLPLSRDKIIVDTATDEIIRRQMIEVLPTQPLTTRRFATLVQQGIQTCISLWNPDKQSVAEFWRRVGSSRGWLRRLGSRISRSFFLKLCMLYDKGSKAPPSNKMQESILQMFVLFKNKNRNDVKQFHRECRAAEEAARAHRDSHQNSRDDSKVHRLGPLNTRLIPLKTFAAEKEKRREEQNHQMEQIGLTGVIPPRGASDKLRPKH